MKKLLKFLLIGSFSIMIVSVISYLVLFFTHNEVSNSHYLYLSILFIIFAGYVVAPIFIISLFVWLFIQSKKTRIIACGILFLVLLSFTPLIEEYVHVVSYDAPITDSDAFHSRIIFPLEPNYFRYLIENTSSYSETKIVSMAGFGIDIIMKEGIGDLWKEIKTNLAKDDKPVPMSEEEYEQCIKSALKGHTAGAGFCGVVCGGYMCVD